MIITWLYSVCSDIPDTHDDPVHPSVQLVRDHYNNPLEATSQWPHATVLYNNNDN